jgi:hypothetical protein
MHRVYEIFEIMPNGTPRRVTVISGVEFAKLALQGLSKRTKNECFAADAKTRQVVMHMNVPLGKSQASRSIFQICYDEKLAVQRAELLKSRGYDAVCILGNDAAKVVLSSIQHYDLFIVGHAAPEETRREIIAWLKANFPGVKILALNPPNQEMLGADYNVRQNEPEAWLSIVSQQLSNSNW